jgi:hypothetical protein
MGRQQRDLLFEFGNLNFKALYFLFERLLLGGSIDNIVPGLYAAELERQIGAG